MKSTLWLCTLVLALTLRAQDDAETPSLTLSAPSATLPGTGGWQIQLVALNPGTCTIYYRPPAALEGRARATGADLPVVFRTGDEATLVIAPGTFATRLYTAEQPPVVSGDIVLEFAAGLPAPLRTALKVDASATPRADVGDPAQSLRHLTNLTPAVSALERTFAGRLGLHESIYFIYGPDAPAAKFQISFKYKLMDLNQPAPGGFTHTLQAGYTQRSLWDINASSSPFYDTSYMPELMLESLAPMPTGRDGWLTRLGSQLAIKHESNGRDGPDSRSLNTINLRAAAMIGPIDDWHLLVIPEVFTYVTSLSDNRDLKDYRGYGQLRLGLSRDARRPSVLYAVRAGKDFNHWTHQVDLTLPFRTKWLNIETAFLVQYFSGYGESLRSYTERSETVRAGFSLVR
ncbi:MAG: phospholipase A [Candidatus Didemnitutus sp.]|nr:phospholipase A [Candidatus Didemnitutus sp.]